MARQSAWSPSWIVSSGPQGQGKHKSPYRFEAVCTQLWLLDLSHSAGHPAWILSVPSSLSLLWKDYTLMVSVLDYTPEIGQTPHIACGGALLQSARTQLCCLGIEGNRWGSICPGNSASAFKMWQMHYRAQRACNCIWRTPNYLLWRQCIALMPPPFLFAKTLTWGLSRKNFKHLPNSPVPPEFWAEGRSPFLCAHSSGKSRYKIVTLHPSSLPTPQHCTTHSG